MKSMLRDASLFILYLHQYSMKELQYQSDTISSFFSSTLSIKLTCIITQKVTILKSINVFCITKINSNLFCNISVYTKYFKQELLYSIEYRLCPNEINKDIQLLYLMCQFMQIIIQHCFQLDQMDAHKWITLNPWSSIIYNLFASP